MTRGLIRDSKVPALKSTGSPPDSTPVRKAAVAVAAFGLLAGLMLCIRIMPRIPSDAASSPPHPMPTKIKATPGGAAAPVADEAAAPAPPVASATSSSLPPPDLADPAAIEILLPPPPSGDYELTMTAEQISALVELRYGALFRTLGLPPGQLARLRALLAERQQATIDAANAALLNGVNPVREISTLLNAIGPVQEAADQALRSELGEDVFTACRDFDRALGARNLAGDFSRLLAATGGTPSPELERQLVQILKNHPGRVAPADMDRAIFGGINTRARISEQAMAEAATMLSPSQLELLRLLQQHQAAEDARR